MKICKRCGSQFERPSGISDRQWLRRAYCSKSCSAKKISLSVSEIEKMYLEDKMSSSDIAKVANVTPTQILRILAKEGISRRSLSESKVLSHSKPEVREKIALSRRGKKLSDEAKSKLRRLTGEKSKNWLGGITMNKQGYICFTSSPKNGDNAGKCLHVLIAEWLYQRKVQPGEHVHHIDGNKLNNNPENLCILTDSEHAKIHGLGEKK